MAFGAVPTVAGIDRLIEIVRLTHNLPAPEVPYHPAGLHALMIAAEIERDPQAWTTFMEWRRMRAHEEDGDGVHRD